MSNEKKYKPSTSTREEHLTARRKEAIERKGLKEGDVVAVRFGASYWPAKIYGFSVNGKIAVTLQHNNESRRVEPNSISKLEDVPARRLRKVAPPKSKELEWFMNTPVSEVAKIILDDRAGGFPWVK